MFFCTSVMIETLFDRMHWSSSGKMKYTHYEVMRIKKLRNEMKLRKDDEIGELSTVFVNVA